MAQSGVVDKKDCGKAPMSLLAALYAPLQEVAKVLAFGNKKYKNIRNYRMVPDAYTRYLDAAIRHIMSAADGEELDPESGLHHLAHATCCTLMALWFGVTKVSDLAKMGLTADIVQRHCAELRTSCGPIICSCRCKPCKEANACTRQ